MNELGFLSVFARAVADYAGVIIGGLSALGGVILTNRAHARRLKEQFAHEREIKNRDREMALRKDVYLNAADAVHAGLIAVGKFANLDIPYDKLTEEYLAKASTVYKVHIIAEEETVRAISIFSTELGAAFLSLTAKRLPLSTQSQQISTLRILVDGLVKEQARILELIKQHNLSGSSDQRAWQVLQENFNFESHRIQETSKNADELAAALALKQLEFMEKCVEESIRLSRLLVPVVVCVRKELELPIDEIEYGRLLEEQIATLAVAVKEFGRQIESLLPPKA